MLSYMGTELLHIQIQMVFLLLGKADCTIFRTLIIYWCILTILLVQIPSHTSIYWTPKT